MDELKDLRIPESTSRRARFVTNELIAGAFSSAVARTCVAPLDFLKIRLQIESYKPLGGRSLLSVTKHIMQTEGPLAFFQGNLAAQCLCVPYGALSFSTYRWCSSWLSDMAGPNKERTNFKNAIAFASGGCSACVATLVTYPLDLLRTRMVAQSSKMVYSSLAHGFLSIVRKQGVNGLYVGLYPTLVGVIPYMSLQFLFYEQSKRLLSRVDQRWKDSPLPSSRAPGQARHAEKALCGFVAGSAAKFLSMPFDVVKKLHQVHHFLPSSDHQPAPTGVVQTAVTLARRRGVAALFRGTLPAVIKAGPYSAMLFGVYEATLGLLRTFDAS